MSHCDDSCLPQKATMPPQHSSSALKVAHSMGLISRTRVQQQIRSKGEELSLDREAQSGKEQHDGNCRVANASKEASANLASSPEAYVATELILKCGISPFTAVPS